MLAYIIRRLILIVPTLFGIMVINFVVIQAAPGGPVDRLIAELKGEGVAATERIGAGALFSAGLVVGVAVAGGLVVGSTGLLQEHLQPLLLGSAAEEVDAAASLETPVPPPAGSSAVVVTSAPCQSLTPSRNPTAGSVEDQMA